MACYKACYKSILEGLVHVLRCVNSLMCMLKAYGSRYESCPWCNSISDHFPDKLMQTGGDY